MTDTELQKFITRANLGKVQRYRRFTSGQQNQTYFVATDDGQYSVRVYQHKTPKELAFELALLNHLRGLPVPHLHQVGNRYYGMVDGHPATIYDYIEGRQRQNPFPSQLTEVGEFLGRFHHRTRAFRWPGPRRKFYDLPDHRIDHIMRSARAHRLPFLRHLPDMARELRTWRLNPRLPQGPIHVDVKPENVLFHRGRLSGVIDFDNSYMGPLMLDLATSMVWFGLVGRKFDFSLAAAVYRGYRCERRLSTIEYRELYRVLRYKFVSHVFVDFESYIRQAASKQYLSWLVHSLYWAYQHLDVYEKQFYSVIKRA